jgi:ABC-type sugar transport system substrate-binding protein
VSNKVVEKARSVSARRVRRGLPLVAAVAALASVAGGSTGATAATTQKSLTIAVIVPQPGNAFYAPLQAGAQKAGKDFNVRILYQGPPDGDPVKQNGMIQAAVQRRVDGIVLASGSADAAIQPVNMARKAGIPVGTTSADTPRSQRNFYFGEDGPAGGRLSAQVLAHMLKKRGKTRNVEVVIGSCLPGAQIQQVRIRSFKAELKKHVQYRVVSEFNSSLDDVKNRQTWETVISTRPNVDVAFGGCAIDTRDAGLALKGEGNREAIAFGYDLLPDTLKLIKEGYIKWALGESPFKQGYEPVRYIVQHLRNGRPLPRGFVPVQMELATLDRTVRTVTKPYGVKTVKLWTNIDALIKRESPYYKRG